VVRFPQWELVPFSIHESSQLYDLDNDFGENHDLSQQHPEIVNVLTSLATLLAHKYFVLFLIKNCSNSFLR
jgi:hypothetical protein